MPKCFITLFVVLFLIGLRAPAQRFVELGTDLLGVSEGSARWIDTDRDGDLDVLLMGEFFKGQQRGVNTRMYRNMRNDQFVQFAPGLPDLHRGDFSVGDYNLDGIDDIAITGEKMDGTLVATIYKGSGSGNYMATGINLTAVRDGSIRFGDMEGDGDLDVLITGDTRAGTITHIYRNDRNNVFTRTDASIRGTKRGVAIWYDYNLDGFPDVFVTGADGQGMCYSMLYENFNGNFSPVNVGIIPLKQSYAATGDYDNDGDLDLLVMGETGNGKLTTRLYRNDRNRNFTRIAIPFEPVRSGFADWGDFDNDGDVDLLISGESAKGPVSKVYQNNRISGFRDLFANVVGLYMSTGQWGDFDHDGDLDILIAGLTNDFRFLTKIYRNDIYVVSDTAAKGEEESEDIFNNSVVVPEHQKQTYFFVYSSTYSDLNSENKKGYFMFISPVKKPKKQYEMEDVYSRLIREKYPSWGLIDQGNIISVGLGSMAEAVKSRQRVIDEYTSRGYTLIEIDW